MTAAVNYPLWISISIGGLTLCLLCIGYLIYNAPLLDDHERPVVHDANPQVPAPPELRVIVGGKTAFDQDVDVDWREGA